MRVFDQVSIPDSHSFLKRERIIKHAFFGQSGHTGCILLYMFALIVVVCYYYDTFVNIDSIGLSVLVIDLYCAKVAICFATAVLLIATGVVKYSSRINNYSLQYNN